MNIPKKIEHLGHFRSLLVDSLADVGEEIEHVTRLYMKDNEIADNIANRRLTNVEILLRQMSQRCGRLADEVATLKVRDGNN